MKESMKKRFAIFMSMVLVLPAIVAMLPTNTLLTEAASNVWMNPYYAFLQDNNKYVVQVEEGQEFYFGDYIIIDEYSKKYESGTASVFSGVKYSTSKKSVATINSKTGLLKAKKSGTANITVKYKNAKTSCQVKVVKKGTFGSSSEINKAKSLENSIKSKIPKKITASNVYENLKALAKYTDYRNENTDFAQKISNIGLLLEESETSSGYKYTKNTNKLVAPNLGRYQTLAYLLNRYGYDNSITSTRASLKLKIKSVTAKASNSTVTFTFNKKLDKNNILAINAYNASIYSCNASAKTAYDYITVTDKKDSMSYYTGSGTFKVNSNKAVYNVKDYNAKKVLKKGHKYQLGRKTTTWTQGRVVTAK